MAEPTDHPTIKIEPANADNKETWDPVHVKTEDDPLPYSLKRRRNSSDSDNWNHSTQDSQHQQDGLTISSLAYPPSQLGIASQSGPGTTAISSSDEQLLNSPVTVIGVQSSTLDFPDCLITAAAAMYKQNLALSVSDLREENTKHMEFISGEVRGLGGTLKMISADKRKKRGQQSHETLEDTKHTTDTIYMLAASKPAIRLEKHRCGRCILSYARECLPAIVIITSAGSNYGRTVLTDCYTCTKAKREDGTSLREDLCQLSGKATKIQKGKDAVLKVQDPTGTFHQPQPPRRSKDTVE